MWPLRLQHLDPELGWPVIKSPVAPWPDAGGMATWEAFGLRNRKSHLCDLETDAISIRVKLVAVEVAVGIHGPPCWRLLFTLHTHLVGTPKVGVT